jgi:hypothetical protein
MEKLIVIEQGLELEVRYQKCQQLAIAMFRQQVRD